jgi:arylsulfatase
MKCYTTLIATIVFAAAASLVHAKPPNVLLIVADDLGYSDVGCYGSEIATPNLDALAKDGLRFTQFYNTGRCWPTRAALLTGYYAQQVLRDGMPGVPKDVKAGGNGKRPAWAKLLPERLKPFGYRSYHSGKWHIDSTPIKAGFDRSYRIDDYDRNFYPRSHYEDDVKLPAVKPGTTFYSSTAIADHAVKVLKDHAANHKDQPFFEYLAFIVPHFPLQAPSADIERYKEHYAAGWDAMREQRAKRMAELGVFKGTMSQTERDLGPPYKFLEVVGKVGPGEVNLPMEWDKLTPEQQKFQAEKMAIHAAMVSRMDAEIGRVLEQVKAMGAEQDTLVMFLSDNGASAELMIRGDGHDHSSVPGSAGSYLCLGPGWSTFSNTPFRRHKIWTHEGGISTPLIVKWPGAIKAHGEVRHDVGHVIDVTPTVLDLAGAKPKEGFAGAPAPAAGTSLAPAFAKDGAVTRPNVWWLHEGNRALRAGDWKIVASGKQAAWELYDLGKDRAESNNLAAAMPDKVKELAAEWERQLEAYRANALRDLPPKSADEPGHSHGGGAG